MATWLMPTSMQLASTWLRVNGSGVVWLAGRRSSKGPKPSVPIMPDWPSCCCQAWARKCATEVLPLVPVIAGQGHVFAKAPPRSAKPAHPGGCPAPACTPAAHPHRQGRSARRAAPPRRHAPPPRGRACMPWPCAALHRHEHAARLNLARIHADAGHGDVRHIIQPAFQQHAQAHAIGHGAASGVLAASVRLVVIRRDIQQAHGATHHAGEQRRSHVAAIEFVAGRIVDRPQSPPGAGRWPGRSRQSWPRSGRHSRPRWPCARCRFCRPRGSWVPAPGGRCLRRSGTVSSIAATCAGQPRVGH